MPPLSVPGCSIALHLASSISQDSPTCSQDHPRQPNLSKFVEKIRFRGSLRGRFERCWLELGLSWLMLELCCDIFGSKMAPKSPKMSQDGAQEPQDEPRWRPRAPRWRPRGRQMQPRWRSWLDVGSFGDQFLMISEASWLSG